MSREGSHRACHGRAYCLRRLPRVWHHTPLGVSVALLTIILGWIAIVTAYTTDFNMTYNFFQNFLGWKEQPTDQTASSEDQCYDIKPYWGGVVEILEIRGKQNTTRNLE